MSILLTEIVGLKDRGLTIEAVVIDFMFKNIQPLKDTVHPAYLYTGVRDMSRVTNMQISMNDVLSRVELMLRGTVVNDVPLDLTLRGTCPRL